MLESLLAMEAPVPDMLCTKCQAHPLQYRCLDCHGTPQLCAECLYATHSVEPGHKIQSWTGTHFEQCNDLTDCLLLFLGHHGRPCPSLKWKGGHSLTWKDKANAVFSKDSSTWCNHKKLCIVDTSRIYDCNFVFCVCADARPEWQQFLDMRYFPATMESTRTVFTFRTLDQYDTESVHTKATAGSYMGKLYRLTNAVFPQDIRVMPSNTLTCIPHSHCSTQNRYQELITAWRVWNDLGLRKRAGFGHDQKLAAHPPPGSLALFCPACPQAGINLPKGWQQEDNQWKWRKTLNIDGNFTADHLSMITPKDVRLADGQGYWVGKAQYQEHLKVAPAPIEVRAIQQYPYALNQHRL